MPVTKTLPSHSELPNLTLLGILMWVLRLSLFCIFQHAARILNEMSVIDQPGAQWHYAQIVDQLHLTEQEIAQVIRKLQSNIEKYDDWITRNITMEVLGNFALHDEALRAYLMPKLEELVKDRRISVSKRALKILQYLESTNSV